jgi:transcription termination/antitermination protein NusG
MVDIETNNNDAKWYVVSTYAGQEKTVMSSIFQRIKANNMEDSITDIVVPTQEVTVVKSGKKKNIEEKFLPGYILVKMVMSDKTWHLVRNTQGVTGFVGTERRPTPLSEQEAKGIIAYTKVQQPTFEASFEVGDSVKVLDGPFKDFVGAISEINENKGQVKVLLSVFGRETPIILDFLQVSKL